MSKNMKYERFDSVDIIKDIHMVISMAIAIDLYINSIILL